MKKLLPSTADKELDEGTAIKINMLYDKYRNILLDDYVDDFFDVPPPSTNLLAEASALFVASYETSSHTGEGQQVCACPARISVCV